MENAGMEACGEAAKINEENPNPTTESEAAAGSDLPPPPRQATYSGMSLSLSQFDPDLDLAMFLQQWERFVQEWERVYKMFRTNAGLASDSESSLDDSETDTEEDEISYKFFQFLLALHEIAYEKYLELGELIATKSRPNASDSRISELLAVHGLLYENLLAFGEFIATKSRGISIQVIALLPSINYKAQSCNTTTDDVECCSICLLEYEDGDALTMLPCNHSYHPRCIYRWLRISKVCPICRTEVRGMAASASDSPPPPPHNVAVSSSSAGSASAYASPPLPGHATAPSTSLASKLLMVVVCAGRCVAKNSPDAEEDRGRLASLKFSRK